MNFSISAFSGFVPYLAGALPLVLAGLVWYALRVGGDVCAVFSHGKTVLKLEVKERVKNRR